MSGSRNSVYYDLRDPEVVELLVRRVIAARRLQGPPWPRRAPHRISYAQLSAAIELLAAPADEPVDPFRLAIRIARAPSL